MKLSIDTISEISQHEASPVTTTSPRTAFEQQLCTHLLSLSEVVETLADRLMELETRLADIEGQQLVDAEIAAVSARPPSKYWLRSTKIRQRKFGVSWCHKFGGTGRFSGV